MIVVTGSDLCPQHPLLKGVFPLDSLLLCEQTEVTEGISCEEAVLKTLCVCGCASVQHVGKLRQTWVPVTLPSTLFFRGEESLV